MKERNFLVIIFVASLLLKLPFALMSDGFGVDESLYLYTAKKMAMTGEFGHAPFEYSVNNETVTYPDDEERFISPLHPLILTPFFFAFGEIGALIVGPLFGSLSIILFYYLGKILFDKKIAKISALLAFFNPALFLLGTRPLTESTAIFFFVLSLIAFFYALKNKKYLVTVPLLAALTFLTRYQYGALLIILLLSYVLLSRKIKILVDRNFAVGIIVALLVIAPWIIFNLNVFGNPIGGSAHQASSDLGFNPSVTLLYIPYLFVVLGTSFPLVLYGIYKVRNNKNWILILAGIAILFLAQIFVFGKVAEERYLVHILPLAFLVGAAGTVTILKKYKKIGTYIFISLMLANIFIGFYFASVFANYPRYAEAKSSIMWTKDNCNSPVMSNSKTQVWYYSGFESVPLRPDLNSSLEIAVKHSVNCVMVTLFEAPYVDPFANQDDFKVGFRTDKTIIYKK